MDITDIFAIFLILLGSFQAYLVLKKDNSKESDKHLFNKWLSWIYIVMIFAGCGSYFIQKNNAGNSEKKLFSFLDTKNSGIIKILNKSISKNALLLKSTDSLNKNLFFLNKTSKLLINQYKTVNSQLSKGLDLDTKQLKERAPMFQIADNEVTWDKSDTNNCYLKIPFINFGKRNATILNTNGYIVFFDRKFNGFYSLNIPGDSPPILLPPFEIKGLSNTVYSKTQSNFKYLQSLTNIAVICLNVKYYDPVTDKDSIITLYSGWSGVEDKFGRFTNLQNEQARKWHENNKLKYVKSQLNNFFSPKNRKTTNPQTK